MKIKGILTSCVTEKELEVELEYEITIKNGERIFSLLDGVTGWESFYIDDKYTNLDKMRESGWLACAGRQKQYAKLFIPAEEMKKALHGIEKVQNPTDRQEIMIILCHLEDEKNIKQKEINLINDRIEKLEKELSDKYGHL